MVKTREELFEEIKNMKLNGDNIYVGNLNEIKKDGFDTCNLCVASFGVAYLDDDGFKLAHKESEFKYVFEMHKIADMIVYNEIFSNQRFGNIDFGSKSRIRGMFVFSPVLYDDYVVSFNNSKTKVKEL